MHNRERIHTLKGENVFIYGATGGIGKALCQVLSEQGANLFIMGRTKSKLKKLGQLLKLDNYHSFHLESILSAKNYESALNWLQGLKKPFRIGINTVGSPIFKKLSQVSFPEWEQSIGINLNAQFLFYRLLNEVKNSTGYELVYFGSASTKEAWQKNGLYGTAKAGLEYFAATLQQEIKPEGGRVWLYKPGSVRTDFFNQVSNHIPSHKMILPEELARIVTQNLLADPRLYYPEITIRSG